MFPSIKVCCLLSSCAVQNSAIFWHVVQFTAQTVIPCRHQFKWWWLYTNLSCIHMEASEEWSHDRIFRNVFIIVYEILICQAYGLKRVVVTWLNIQNYSHYSFNSDQLNFLKKLQLLSCMIFNWWWRCTNVSYGVFRCWAYRTEYSELFSLY